MLPNNLLIATDLDGTLLGHEDYDYQAVLPVITELTSGGVPVVLATSKTRSEVERWQARLGLNQPFIVENGSAAVFPDGAEIELGADLTQLEDFLAPFMGSVTSFVHCPLEEAIRLTGLDAEEAELARNRHYSIPFVLHDQTLEQSLAAKAEGAGLRILRGGRFLHLQGQCDKQLALREVKHQLESANGISYRVIALGDNQNDQQMLNEADVAVVLNTARGHQLTVDGSLTIYTRGVAPGGWIEGLTRALEQFKE